MPSVEIIIRAQNKHGSISAWQIIKSCQYNSLDDLQEVRPAVDEARQPVERPPQGRGSPAQVPRQLGGVGCGLCVAGGCLLRLSPLWPLPADVARVLPLTQRLGPRVIPTQRHWTQGSMGTPASLSVC